MGVEEEGAEVAAEAEAEVGAEQNVLLIGTVLHAVPPVVLEVNQLVLNAVLQIRARDEGEEVMAVLLEIMGTQGVPPTTDGHRIMAPIITDLITAAGTTTEIMVMVITVEIVVEVGSERQIGTVLHAAQLVVLEADQIALNAAPRIQLPAEDTDMEDHVDTEDLQVASMITATEIKWRETKGSVLMTGIASSVVRKAFSAADQIVTNVMHRTQICQPRK